MKTPFRTPMRGGQPGDLTLLLEPIDPNEIEIIRTQQLRLQKHFGGRIMEPVHLTCQRFTLSDDQCYPALVKTLKTIATQYEPFTLQAQGQLPFFSAFRQVYLLKWEVILDPLLASFSARLENALQLPWLTSLYTPGWISTLVTALVDIDPERPQTLEGSPGFPYSLFTPGILTISKMHRPSEFEILDKILL